MRIISNPAGRTLPAGGVLRCAASLAVALTLAAPASATIFKVGVGAGCTHADLFSAITAAAASPGQDEIRLLANTSHQGPFVILTDGLVLRGGFSSCAATEPTGFSTLLGDNSNRALFLLVSGASLLERLSITGGQVTGNGGGLLVQGGHTVNLVNVLIFGNTATGKGGNVYVNASPGTDLMIFESSLLSAGSATDGGGLACVGDGRVRFFDSTTVANNTASGKGGGVYLAASCDLELDTGGSSGGIVSNIAGDVGGGAYIEGGAELNTFLAADGLSTIEANSAGSSGGGVYVTGTGSVLRAFFARLTGNHAGGSGGGIFADDHAIAAIGRPTGVFDPCFDSVRCALIDDNSAPIGGAIFTDDLAQVSVHGTHIEGNSSTLFNPVAMVQGGASASIRSTVIADNDGATPITVTGAGSALTLGNVTFVHNTNFGPGMISIGTASVGPVRILTSLFDQQGALFVPGFPAGVAPQIDCVMTKNAGLLVGFPPAAVQRAIVVADPQLANIAAGNYQLKGTSPAIDFCDLTQWNGDDRDIDWQARDIDDPGHPNPMPGFRDLGADEYSVIFADGFETGNTLLWDQVVP